MEYTILVGNALDVCPELSASSIQAVITSPPYYGLRDYGAEPQHWPAFSFTPMPLLPEVHIEAWRGSLGLEPDPMMYVGHIVLIFRKIRRALKDDGLIWINIGDSYAGSGKGAWDKEGRKTKEIYSPGTQAPQMKMPKKWNGIKAKNLMGMPWRVAFALQGDGWYLRNDNIWEKPNAMPSSVKDRLSQSHEYFFLLSKSADPFFDQDAIREPYVSIDGRKKTTVQQGTNSIQHRNGERWPHPKGRNKRSVWHVNTKPSNWDFCKNCNRLFVGDERKVIGRFGERDEQENVKIIRICPCRAVNQFESHFATYPYDLLETPVKASIVKDSLTDRSIILDPFSGAGSTGVVAVRNGANYIGIEINPTYAEISRQRIAKDGITQRSFID